jgi:hypothetical protein
MLRKLDLFPSSCEGETPLLLGLSERVNLVQRLRLALSMGPNRVGVPSNLRTETNQISELSYFQVSRIPDD